MDKQRQEESINKLLLSSGEMLLVLNESTVNVEVDDGGSQEESHFNDCNVFPSKNSPASSSVQAPEAGC